MENDREVLPVTVIADPTNQIEPGGVSELGVDNDDVRSGKEGAIAVGAIAFQPVDQRATIRDEVEADLVFERFERALANERVCWVIFGVKNDVFHWTELD